MSHLFCFGLGYCASALARRLSAQGWSIAGTSRDGDGAARIRAEGWSAIEFDGTASSPRVADAVRSATHILLSIPPGAKGDRAFDLHRADIAASQHIQWIGYLSTVGVYGNADGAWVSEDTEARPGSERGRRRLGAERSWLEFGREASISIMVFRLPGIYGPGRSVLDDLKAGTARRIVKPGQVFNRVHVDDIASALETAMKRPKAGAVYNVTDDFPAPPQDVVAFGAELLGLPCPPALDFATAHLSEMTRSFYSESKRVSNRRMKHELELQLAYPTYREGLRALAKLP